MKNKKEFTQLQNQYLQDCAMLQALGYPDDLFDGLYLAYVKSLKNNNYGTQKNKTIKTQNQN